MTYINKKTIAFLCTTDYEVVGFFHFYFYFVFGEKCYSWPEPKDVFFFILWAQKNNEIESEFQDFSVLGLAV